MLFIYVYLNVYKDTIRKKEPKTGIINPNKCTISNPNLTWSFSSSPNIIYKILPIPNSTDFTGKFQNVKNIFPDQNGFTFVGVDPSTSDNITQNIYIYYNQTAYPNLLPTPSGSLYVYDQDKEQYSSQGIHLTSTNCQVVTQPHTCIPECSDSNKCGGSNGCDGYCPTTELFTDNTGTWVIQNDKISWNNLSFNSTSSTDGILSGSGISVQISKLSDTEIIAKTTNALTGISGSGDIFVFDPETNIYSSKSSIYIYPTLCIDLPKECRSTDALNMVYVYDQDGNLVKSTSIYKEDDCTYPKNISDILTKETTMIPNIKNLGLSYISVVINLLGNLTCGFTNPDQSGNFGPDPTNIHINRINSKCIVLTPPQNIPNIPGSLPKCTIYVLDNNTGYVQTFTLSRSISLGALVSGNYPVTVNPLQINPSNENTFIVNSPPTTGLIPAYLYIGPYIENGIDINNMPGIIGESEYVYDIPNGTIQKGRSLPEVPLNDYPVPTKVCESFLPSCFSWRYFGGDMIEKPRLQPDCQCWAYSLASSIGDRFAIKFGVEAPYPSVSWLISGCGFSATKCIISSETCAAMGTTMGDLAFAYNFPLPLSSCWPDDITKNKLYKPFAMDNLKKCCSTCCNGVGKLCSVRLKISDRVDLIFPNTIVNNGNWDSQYIENQIDRIKTSIFHYGPILSWMAVSPTFYDYVYRRRNEKEVYVSNENIDSIRKNIDIGKDKYSFHMIVITGWGTYKGIKYWEIRNSWGTKMPGNGYVRIQMTTENNQNMWIGIDMPLLEGNKWTMFPRGIRISNTQDEVNTWVKDSILNKVKPGPPVRGCP